MPAACLGVYRHRPYGVYAHTFLGARGPLLSEAGEPGGVGLPGGGGRGGKGSGGGSGGRSASDEELDDSPPFVTSSPLVVPSLSLLLGEPPCGTDLAEPLLFEDEL